MRSLRPPGLVLILIGVFVPLGRRWPVIGPGSMSWRLIGIAAAVVGLGLAFAGSRQFGHVGTNIDTFRDPQVLVRTGLFAWSRNPMYVGFLVTLIGVAVLVGGVTAWAAPGVFLVAASQWYIPFEERRLIAIFGSDYGRYCLEVRRWFGRRSSPPAESAHQLDDGEAP